MTKSEKKRGKNNPERGEKENQVARKGRSKRADVARRSNHIFGPSCAPSESTTKMLKYSYQQSICRGNNDVQRGWRERGFAPLNTKIWPLIKDTLRGGRANFYETLHLEFLVGRSTVK